MEIEIFAMSNWPTTQRISLVYVTILQLIINFYFFLYNWFSLEYLAVWSYTRAVVYQINTGVPQGSKLTRTLCLIHINVSMFAADDPINSFTDDITLHFNFNLSFNKPVSLIQLSFNRQCRRATQQGSRQQYRLES